MGCDIHAHAERREGTRWVRVPMTPEPFDWRSYERFGFLADVRNYSAVPPITAPRGFPEDASDEVRKDYEGFGLDAHTPSWLSVDELTAFDYEAEIEDRRCSRMMPAGYISGGETCEPGEGKRMTLREFLGKGFFDDLESLKQAGAERVVFWFDN